MLAPSRIVTPAQAGAYHEMASLKRHGAGCGPWRWAPACAGVTTVCVEGAGNSSDTLYTVDHGAVIPPRKFRIPDMVEPAKGLMRSQT
jgi:hypothetical protein